MFFGVVFAKALGLHVEAGAVVLPLLATQILWINLVTDGPPALALGVDPVDEGVMNRPPRPRTEGVLTLQMWIGIILVGVVMAAGTLVMLDSTLAGGLIEANGDLRYAQTMAFTTLVMFQLFNVFNARSDDRSAFHGLFRNPWLWGAVGVSLALHMTVIYVPFLQRAFSTTNLALGDWLYCASVASSVLWIRELSKVFIRHGKTEAKGGTNVGRRHKAR
jgi:Ca2+-transporting ATPase